MLSMLKNAQSLGEDCVLNIYSDERTDGVAGYAERAMAEC